MRGVLDAFRLRKGRRSIRLTFRAMPAVYFTIELPDGVTKECYSPSTVVQSYFKPGDEMLVSEFLLRGREAFARASERVRQKFGFSCNSAAAQLESIEAWMRAYPDEGIVRILEIKAS
jgi:uncharacterized repeat protein (TIGR04042 family)